MSTYWFRFWYGLKVISFIQINMECIVLLREDHFQRLSGFPDGSV